MSLISLFVAAIVIAEGFALGNNVTDKAIHGSRKFFIDYSKDEFIMDDKPFRYVSGSFHYFRALPEVWEDRLKTMKAAGLNAVDTYIEWSLHNPKYGVYNFKGIADIERFLQIAQDEHLYVILRPGPYICAERDNGGLPYWLFSKYPEIKLRTSDESYLKEVEIWYSVLMPKLQKYFYGNGGPIIMVQVENEYGAFAACDKLYLNWLRDLTEKYVKGAAVLFTTDIPNHAMSCGVIENVFATTDFGLERIGTIDNVWKTLRSVQSKGPLVNSEFYPGWLTHWQEQNQRRDAESVARALKKILSHGASVNFYMFFGGTNFGFTAGANDVGYGGYASDITSYDYDAVMDESGDPTEKYHLIRKILSEEFGTNIAVPEKSSKTAYGSINMTPIADLLSGYGLEILRTSTEKSIKPKSFEELNQFSGLVLYETILPTLKIDPTVLTVNKLSDRGLVFLDGVFIGALSRQNKIYSLPISSGMGEKLQIVVENQGRINFDVANDMKGILGSVTIQDAAGKPVELQDWVSTSIPLESTQITKLVDEHKINGKISVQKGRLMNGPAVFYGSFDIKNEVTDTYLDTTGWGKGVAFLNGFNLGRYWPLVGPQITLYVPKEILRPGINDLVLVELQKTPDKLTIELVDKPQLDAKQSKNEVKSNN